MGTLFGNIDYIKPSLSMTPKQATASEAVNQFWPQDRLFSDCLKLQFYTREKKRTCIELALLDWFYRKQPDQFLCLPKIQVTCIQIILKHAVAKSVFKMNSKTLSQSKERCSMIHPPRECSCSGHNGKLASTRLVFSELCSSLNSHWVTNCPYPGTDFTLQCSQQHTGTLLAVRGWEIQQVLISWQIHIHRELSPAGPRLRCPS